MKTIINATNLLGDSLYSLQPINQYRDEMGASEEDLILVADRGLVFQMFQDTFLGPVKLYDDIDKAIQSCPEGEDVKVIRLSAGDSGHWCFTIAQQTGGKFQPHISQGYAHLLGMTLKEPIMPYAPWNNWEPENRDKVRIGIAPFSKSCSRHTGERPNKTLDDWKWMHIINYLRQHCDELKVFGGPKDIMLNVPISEDERCVAKSFDDLRKQLKRLTAFISVDNGLGHIASVLDTPTILIWPVVSSIEFIAPLWAPRTKYLMNVEPNTITPSTLLAGIRIFMKELVNDGDASGS